MRPFPLTLNIKILKDKMRLHPDVTSTLSINTFKKLEQRLIDIHGNHYSYKFSTYKGARIKMFVYCNYYKKLFKIEPRVLTRGSGCYQCGLNSSAKKQTKTHSEYIKNVYKIYGDRLEVVGTYKTNGEPIIHRYTRCGHTRNSAPTDILKREYKCMHCTSRSLGSVKHLPGKIYALKIVSGKTVAYKIGITSKDTIIGGRYNRRKDIAKIKSVEYVQLETMEEAFELEQAYCDMVNYRDMYRGRHLLQNIGNSELSLQPIDLAEFLKAYDKKYINCKVIREV